MEIVTEEPSEMMEFADYAGTRYQLPRQALEHCTRDRSGRYYVIPRDVLAKARVRGEHPRSHRTGRQAGDLG